MKRIQAKNWGLSLLEILVAMFVLSISIAILASAFPLGKRASRQADELAVVVFLAEEKMEELLATPPAQWPIGALPEKLAPPYERYQLTVERFPSPVGAQELVHLRVSVSTGGRERPLYSLETLAFQ